jgi:hypothetical protein
MLAGKGLRLTRQLTQTVPVWSVEFVGEINPPKAGYRNLDERRINASLTDLSAPIFRYSTVTDFARFRG